MAKPLNHTNILANASALYAADVMVRIDAMFADEERQMRECMANRDNYDIDGIQSVIAHHDNAGSTRRADIARAILAERLAELEPLSIDIAFADETQIGEIQRVEKRNANAVTMGQLIALRDKWDKDGQLAMRDHVVELINEWAAVMLKSA